MVGMVRARREAVARVRVVGRTWAVAVAPAVVFGMVRMVSAVVRELALGMARVRLDAVAQVALGTSRIRLAAMVEWVSK